jgi:DNA-binding MarR family transcriptional regulator
MNKIAIENISKMPDPRSFIGFQLWQKSNLCEKYINQQLKPFDITQSEIFPLISIAILTNEGGEVTQTKLSDFTGISLMSISKILKSLERKGYITRHTGKDSRSKAITITEDGLQILIKSAQTLQKANSKLFPETNSKQFYNYLLTIK